MLSSLARGKLELAAVDQHLAASAINHLTDTLHFVTLHHCVAAAQGASSDSALDHLIPNTSQTKELVLDPPEPSTIHSAEHSGLSH